MAKLTETQHKIRELIGGVSATMHGGIQAPALVAAVMSRHWSNVHNDTEVLRHLISIGLSYEARALLNRYADPADDITDGQLTLFPEAERGVAKALEGLVRAYVPSRGEHVPIYDATQITPDELIEAGRYRITQGHGCIRAGNAMIRLAMLRGDTAEQAA